MSNTRHSRDQPQRFQLPLHLRAAIDSLVSANPLREFAERLLQPAPGLEAEKLARQADIGEAVADVAGTRLTQDVRLDRSLVHGLGQKSCDLCDAASFAAADVDCLPAGFGLFQ